MENNSLTFEGEVATFDVVSRGIGQVTLGEKPEIDTKGNVLTKKAITYQSTDPTEFGIFSPGAKFKVVITKL